MSGLITDFSDNAYKREANEKWTNHNDDEVEPAPGVREVLLEAVCHHLDHHLKDEDDCERSVGDVQSVFKSRP